MAMKVFNVGDVLAAADLNEYGVNTLISIKGSDTSRASNTTLTADPDLAATLGASKIYEMHMVVNFFNGGGSSGNIKFSFSLPAGATFSGGTWGNASGTVSAASYDASANAFPSLGAATWNGNLEDSPILFMGLVTTAGTAGAITFNWAQQSSSGTATVVRQNSYMFLRRVA